MFLEEISSCLESPHLNPINNQSPHPNPLPKGEGI